MFRHAAALIGDNRTASNVEVYLQQCRRPDEHNALFSVRVAKLDTAGRTQFVDLIDGTLTSQQAAEYRTAGCGAHLGV